MSSTSGVRLRSAVLALTVATVVLSGCSTTEGLSAPTTGTTAASTGTTAMTTSSGGTGSCAAVLIAMRSGSVPAPYNYQWSMTLEDDQGTINAKGSAPGGSPYEHTFVADAAVRTALCEYAAELAQQGPVDGVGGSTAQAEYTPAGGSRVVGQSGVDASDVPERMSAALPAGEWAALQGQLDTWSSAPKTSATPTS